MGWVRSSTGHKMSRTNWVMKPAWVLAGTVGSAQTKDHIRGTRASLLDRLLGRVRGHVTLDNGQLVVCADQFGRQFGGRTHQGPHGVALLQGQPQDVLSRATGGPKESDRFVVCRRSRGCHGMVVMLYVLGFAFPFSIRA